MKLTDVFGVQVDDGQIACLVFGEAKAGTTPPGLSLGQDSYRQIHGDIENDEPHILFFTLDRLWEANDESAYLQLEEAMNRVPAIPRILRIVFVFDEAVWKEEILQRLNDDFNSGEQVLEDNFKCYVLTRSGLKGVIADAYAEAKRIVDNG